MVDIRFYSKLTIVALSSLFAVVSNVITYGAGNGSMGHLVMIILRVLQRTIASEGVEETIL